MSTRTRIAVAAAAVLTVVLVAVALRGGDDDADLAAVPDDEPFDTDTALEIPTPDDDDLSDRADEPSGDADEASAPAAGDQTTSPPQSPPSTGGGQPPAAGDGGSAPTAPDTDERDADEPEAQTGQPPILRDLFHDTYVADGAPVLMLDGRALDPDGPDSQQRVARIDIHWGDGTTSTAQLQGHGAFGEDHAYDPSFAGESVTVRIVAHGHDGQTTTETLTITLPTLQASTTPAPPGV